MGGFDKWAENVYDCPMEADWIHIPWYHPDLWREANESLAQIIWRNSDHLEEAHHLALRIKAELISTFPLMDQLCRAACPGCADVCCQRAWIWFDLKDLLFLHLAGLRIPRKQLLRPKGQPCPYITADGCRLPRLQRPFVCTWYLCPAQTLRLYSEPGKTKRTFDRNLRKIKELRRKMESKYIQATC